MNDLELLLHTANASMELDIVVKINNEFIPLKNVKISKGSDVVDDGTIILEVA